MDLPVQVSLLLLNKYYLRIYYQLHSTIFLMAAQNSSNVTSSSPFKSISWMKFLQKASVFLFPPASKAFFNSDIDSFPLLSRSRVLNVVARASSERYLS